MSLTRVMSTHVIRHLLSTVSFIKYLIRTTHPSSNLIKDLRVIKSKYVIPFENNKKSDKKRNIYYLSI